MKKNEFYLQRTYRNGVLIKHETLTFLSQDKDGMLRFKSLSEKNHYVNIGKDCFPEHEWSTEEDGSVIWKSIITKN